MRLRSLEIQGFKSFPDRITLNFDSGITAVVGPNGSGKSNISDAVRWVLGEQSTKNLRGSRMEDVIFGGTQTRKALGFAHVQLNIDNSDGALEGYGEEVAISRRLYRSGESEYRLGGVGVRLKDINELLMDTGLGRDGYAIIGQGKIAEIVSARSAERREIFEEAAGISKFRYRKEEAERRLAGAEENLVRLRDILLELESRVGPLKEQSEKARAFLEYSAEKKTLEISLWMTELEDIRRKVSEQEDKLYAEKNSYELLEGESSKLELEIEAAYSRMQSLDLEIESKRTGLRELEESISAGESETAVLKNEITHREQEISRIDGERSETELGADELRRQLAEKESELSGRDAELVQLQGRVDAAEFRLEEQREQAARASAELDELGARRESVLEAVRAAQLERVSSETSLNEGRARLESMLQSGGAQDGVISEMEDAVEECGRLREEQEELASGLQNSLRGYALKRESRVRAMGELESRVQKLRAEALEHSRRAKLLEELETNMEGFAGSVKYILAQSKKGAIKGLIGTVSSIISTGERYTLAIETALGAAMQNIVTEDEQTAKRGIRMLQDAKAGRATFLPLTTVRGGRTANTSAIQNMEGYIGTADTLVRAERRYEGIVAQLLGRVVVAEDLDSASVIAKTAGYSLRVVTLDGQVINAGGSYTGGSSARGTGVLGRRGEIDRLTAQAAELEKQAASHEPSLKTMREEISALDAAVGGVEAEIKTAQEEAVRLRATGEQMRKNLEAARRAREQARDELEALAARLEKLTGSEAESARLMGEMEAQLGELERRVESAASRRDMLSVGAQAALSAVGEQKMLQLSAQKDRELLAQETERLRQSLTGAGARAEELSARRREALAEIAGLHGRIEELRERRESGSLEKMEISERIAECTAQRTGLEARITGLYAREKEIAAEREKLSRELAVLESARDGLIAERDSIIGKMWDEYGVTRSEAALLAVELPENERRKASRRLTELRSSIRALGAVNLAAVEEYAAVSERYEFLSAQVRDVEQSRAQLLELIGGLTGDMRRIFNESFAKVARNFSEIFAELFGGGSAQLTLTEGEDELEAGVEISVQPPGKIIKNMALLSGGEQALVAIAVYFAILRERPAPFCVLDEIEAALDDVNVVKFAGFLRRMSHTTQFIAITHRRGTMEEADVLYGVTMQDEGVSKLLELQIGEVESRLGLAQ